MNLACSGNNHKFLGLSEQSHFLSLESNQITEISDFNFKNIRGRARWTFFKRDEVILLSPPLAAKENEIEDDDEEEAEEENDEEEGVLVEM